MNVFNYAANLLILREMASSTTKSVLRWLAFGSGIALLMIAAGLTVTLSHHTMFNPWMLFSLIFLGSAVSAIPAARLWRTITGWESVVWNALLHIVALSALLSAVILSVNYFCARNENFISEKVIVEEKIRKTEYTSRRISRRVYTRGNPYYVYEVELRFLSPDFAGKDKTVRISKKLYDSVRRGDTATVSLGHGALGMPVFNDRTLTPLHPRKKIRKSRFPGPKYAPRHLPGHYHAGES